MNRIFFIAVLLIALVLTASADRRRLLMSRNAAAASGFTVDLLQTFNFATLSQANLEANDSASVTWTLDDAGSRMFTTNYANRDTLSAFNGAVVSSSYGLARAYPSTGVAETYFNIGADQTRVTLGSWFRYAGNPGVNKRIFRARSASSDSVQIDFQYSTDTVTFNGGANSNGVALVEGNFYWLTLDLNRNATCTGRIYDTSNSQVGSDFTITAPDVALRVIRFSNYNSELGDTGITFYWGTTAVDWTSPVFPLGP